MNVELINQNSVRDLYRVDPKTLVKVNKDQVSFNGNNIPIGTLSEKGAIVNKLSEFWLNYTSDIVPNTLITTDNSKMPKMFRTKEMKSRCMKLKQVSELPVECIVRGYLAGKGWEEYKKNGCISNIILPQGLSEFEKLATPVYTPKINSEYVSYERTITLFGEELAKELRDTSLTLYRECAYYALQCELIIADTKFKFGIDQKGRVVITDELLTPDNTRYWTVYDYQSGRKGDSLDKQYLHNWMKDNGWDEESEIPENVISTTAKKYFDVYRMLTGSMLY